MSFGWSATDIIKLIELSAKVYAAFNDASKSSPVQVEALVRELGNFHDSLERLTNLLNDYNKPIPMVFDDFEKTLNDCKKFLLPYADSLIDRPKGFNYGVKVISFAGKEKDVERFRARINGHVQSIVLYIQHVSLQLSLEAQQLALDRQHLHVPSPPVNIPSRQSRRATTGQSGLMSTVEADFQREVWFAESKKLIKFLSGTGQHDASSMHVDREVLLKLRAEVDSALARAENREKRETLEQLNHGKQPIFGSPGKMTIADSLNGSPKIQVEASDHEQEGGDLWTPLPMTVQKEPSRANTAQTFDSALGDMYSIHDEATASNGSSTVSMFSNPWEQVRQDPNTYASAYTSSRPGSVASNWSHDTMSSGNRSKRTSNGSAHAISPGGNTPLFLPESVGCFGRSPPSPMAGMPAMALPPPAVPLEWHLVSETAEVEYCAKGQWRKPQPCIISRCRRHQDGGLSLRTTIKARGGSIMHHLPPERVTIPLATHDVVRGQRRTCITVPLGRRASFQPTDITDIKYLFLNRDDCDELQREMYQQTPIYSHNVKAIESDQQAEEARGQSLRIFKDGIFLTLLFYTNRRDRGKRVWIEERHIAFERLPASTLKKTSSKDLKLYFSLHPEEHAKGKLSRSLSQVRENGSGNAHGIDTDTVATFGDSTRNSSLDAPLNRHKLKWVRIHFEHPDDRNEFIEVWNSYFQAILS